MQLIFLHLLTLDMTCARGHSYKLLAHHSRIDLRKNFFSERIVPVWNGLYATDKDFNSLRSVRSCIVKADLSKYLVL